MSDTPLGRKIIVGSAMTVSSRGISRLLDLVALIVLARLLTPSDFGLVAIASSLITIAEAVFELPLVSILSREDELQRSHLDTSFTLTLIKGLALSVVGALLSAGAVVGYHDLRLGAVTLCLAVGPIFRGMQSPGLVVLFRDVRFSQTSLIELGGKLVGLTAALIVAFVFHSYWALVVNVVLTAATALIASYLIAPYRPRLSLAEWGVFSSILKWNSASQLITAANWQCDRVILAAFVPQAEIGRYALASTMAVFPEQAAVKPIGGPVLAALAKVASDPGRLARVYLQTSRAVVAVGAPLFILLSTLGPRACIMLLGGQKWAGAAPLLVWLAIPPLFALPYASLSSLAIVTGKTKLFAKRSFYEFAVQIPLAAVLIYFFGINGAISSRFITAAYMLIVSLFLVKRIGNISLLQQVACLREAAFASVSMSLVLLMLQSVFGNMHGFKEVLEISLAAFLGVAVYIIIYLVFWTVSGQQEGFEAGAILLIRRFATSLAPPYLRPFWRRGRQRHG